MKTKLTIGDADDRRGCASISVRDLIIFSAISLFFAPIACESSATLEQAKVA